MPGQEGLRMNNTRMMNSRAELESVVSTLNDDLNLFMDTGGMDRSMCSGVRAKMADLTRRWEGVTKDFTTLLTTTLDKETKKLTLESQEQYRKAYYGAIKNAGAGTSELFNTLERERLDREASNTGGAAGGGGGGARTGAPPRVDESLRPDFKCSYLLSLNKFNRWMETANAWGLALDARAETAIGTENVLQTDL